MAIEKAREFLQRLNSDESLARSLSGGDWVASARRAGYDFTREELDQARQCAQGELSPDELARVSGGSHTGCYTGGASASIGSHNDSEPEVGQPQSNVVGGWAQK